MLGMPVIVLGMLFSPFFRFYRSTPIWQLCVYVATWVLCGIGPILLGLIGANRARKLRVGGFLYAVVGIILGALNCAAVPWVSDYLNRQSTYEYGISHAWVGCSANMKSIGGGILLFANEHKGRFPDSLDEVLTEDVDTYSFVCPLSGLAPAPTGATSLNGATSFIYLGKGMTDKSDPSLIVLYEPLQNHKGITDDAHFLYADGHVATVKRRDAQKMIELLKAGVNPPK